MDLRVCTYEDRPEAMDSLILMGESLCRADSDISLHLTVPQAPPSVKAWAKRWPKVTLSTNKPPDGVTGWDVKPWLLLQELDAGRPEALWLDDDMIVSRPISSLVKEFPSGSLIVAQEWDAGTAMAMSHFWGWASARSFPNINACVLRVTQAHRRLLERYLQMTQDPRYREVQTLPIGHRAIHLLGDTPLLIALLESEEFGHVPFEYLRLGRHIAQCAGSSGYRPQHRLLDLFRGLPALIHGLGRKPWAWEKPAGLQGFLMQLAFDVSPYVLAAQGVAKSLGMSPEWAKAHTSLGVVLRKLTAGHPGMAGMPLAVPHTLLMSISQMAGSRKAHAIPEGEPKRIGSATR